MGKILLPVLITGILEFIALLIFFLIDPARQFLAQQ